MKQESAPIVENMQNNPVPQAVVESDKPGGKAKQRRKQPDGVRLPLLVEFTYTFSTLLLIILASIIVVASLLAGASLWTLVTRTSVTIVLMGGLLMFLCSQISSGLLFSFKIEQEEAQKALEESTNQEQMQESNLTEAA